MISSYFGTYFLNFSKLSALLARYKENNRSYEFWSTKEFVLPSVYSSA